MNESNESRPAEAAFPRAAYTEYVGMLCGRLKDHRLGTVAAELDLTAEQVEADRELVARVGELSQQHGARGVAENDLRHLRDHRAELQRRQQRELDDRDRAIDRAAKRLGECNAAAGELAKLKAARPELFDAAASPPSLHR